MHQLSNIVVSRRRSTTRVSVYALVAILGLCGCGEDGEDATPQAGADAAEMLDTGTNRSSDVSARSDNGAAQSDAASSDNDATASTEDAERRRLGPTSAWSKRTANARDGLDWPISASRSA